MLAFGGDTIGKLQDRTGDRGLRSQCRNRAGTEQRRPPPGVRPSSVV